MAGGSFGGGDGSSGSPYLVEDAADLDAVRNNLAAHYRQTHHIDAGALDPIGTLASPFTGGYDGNWRVIRNLEITSNTNNAGVALFAALAGAHVQRLGIVSGYVEGTGEEQGVALLAAVIDGGEIHDVLVSGEVVNLDPTAMGASGIAHTLIGGADIQRCGARVVARGPIAAGFVVLGEDATLENVFAHGRIEGIDNETPADLGGFAYVLEDDIDLTNGYADVSFALYDESSEVGGFVAVVTGSPDVTGAYYNAELSGIAIDDEADALTSVAMRVQDSFVGWDFDDVWSVHELLTTPFFQFPTEFLNFFVPIMDDDGLIPTEERIHRNVDAYTRRTPLDFTYSNRQGMQLLNSTSALFDVARKVIGQLGPEHVAEAIQRISGSCVVAVEGWEATNDPAYGATGNDGVVENTLFVGPNHFFGNGVPFRLPETVELTFPSPHATLTTPLVVFVEFWRQRIDPITGEGLAGSVDALDDAVVYPEGYRDGTPVAFDSVFPDVTQAMINSVNAGELVLSQWQWRVRVSDPGVDFGSHPWGVDDDSAVLVQAGHDAPLSGEGFDLVPGEDALFVATSETYGSIDGHVYAIPWLRLDRPPVEPVIAPGDVQPLTPGPLMNLTTLRSLLEDHLADTGNVHDADHADLNNVLTVDPTSENTTRDKHVSNKDLFDILAAIADLVSDLGSLEHSDLNNVLGVDPTSEDTTRDKHVSNKDLFDILSRITALENAVNDIEEGLEPPDPQAVELTGNDTFSILEDVPSVQVVVNHSAFSVLNGQGQLQIFFDGQWRNSGSVFGVSSGSGSNTITMTWSPANFTSTSFTVTVHSNLVVDDESWNENLDWRRYGYDPSYDGYFAWMLTS